MRDEVPDVQVRANVPQGTERGTGSMQTGHVLTSRTMQETLNYWKQLPHVLKYFRADEDPTAKLPNNFITGFLEVWTVRMYWSGSPLTYRF